MNTGTIAELCLKADKEMKLDHLPLQFQNQPTISRVSDCLYSLIRCCPIKGRVPDQMRRMCTDNESCQYRNSCAIFLWLPNSEWKFGSVWQCIVELFQTPVNCLEIFTLEMCCVLNNKPNSSENKSHGKQCTTLLEVRLFWAIKYTSFAVQSK